MVLGILILLIEIFTLSLAGFLFFLCMLALFVQRKIDFNNIFSRLLVVSVQLISFTFIIANFLATTSLLQLSAVSGKFRMYGINALSDFLISDVARGYIICLILVFIVGCTVQRIFVYSNIWFYANRFIELQEITGE